MHKNTLKFKEKKFNSPYLYNAVLKGKKGEFTWDRGKRSEIAEYLSQICFENKYFFDGQVLVKIKLNREYIKTYIGDEGNINIRYREQLNLRWQPSDKEPSELIKIITEEFGFKEPYDDK